MKKNKLLLITAISPFPQNSGGATRIKNTIKEISKYFEVNLISFKSNDIELSEKEELEKWCQKIIYITPKQKTVGSYVDLGQPYWFSDWYSPELIITINEFLKKNKIDIIQVEFSQLLYLISYIKKKQFQKIIFTSHDISTISFYRRFIETKDIKRKISHFLRLLEIYFYEKKYLPKFDTIISVSQKDQQTLKHYFPKKNIICLENGIDKINFLKKTPYKVIKLGYIGSFEHTPNLNAVKYFFDQITPLLDKEKINYEFYLAGKNNPEYIKNNFPKIINLGQVKETIIFYKKIDCLITPIFSGSGSRIKIIESLSFGVPVISSPIGAEGINIKSSFLQIVQTPAEYVFVIKKIHELNKEKLFKQLEPLLWENIFKKYNSIDI